MFENIEILKNSFALLVTKVGSDEEDHEREEISKIHKKLTENDQYSLKLKTLIEYAIKNLFIFCKPTPGEFKNETLFVEIYESLTFLKVSDHRRQIKLTIDNLLVPATTRLYG